MDEDTMRSIAREVEDSVTLGWSADQTGRNNVSRRPSGSCTCRGHQLAVLRLCWSYDRGLTTGLVGGAGSGVPGAMSNGLRARPYYPCHRRLDLTPYAFALPPLTL
jgi:hypothetical protein